MNLGKTIKDIRGKRNLTQKELATMCEVGQNTISMIESAGKNPNKTTLKKIAEAFKVPVPVLYLLSMEWEDVEESKRDKLKLIVPIIEKSLQQIFND